MNQTSRHDSDARPFGVEDRRRFLDLIAREINTPLNGVVAVAGLLARQPLTADSQAYVRTILDSSQSLLRRLEETMDLIAGEAGSLDLQPHAVQLRAAMDEVQAEWQSRRAGACLLVSYDGDPDLAATLDSRRLKQLFDGLIEEALAVTPRGAVEASLRARQGADGVLLEGRVRDAGPSLSDAEIERLFTSQTPRKGSGLSLPLCREIVRAHGGSLRAERNAGPGVTVVFQLLAARIVAESQDDEEAGAAVAHVLIVDDNATNRIVAESLCEMFDCTTESVEDGVEAVEAARSGRFDLILMDIKMPRMDGVEATRQIRALPGRAGQAPIIALTANADPEDARSYLAAGMCDVVEKPIKPDRLLQAMNAVFAADPPASAVQAA